jgi:hypothetical protein
VFRLTFGEYLARVQGWLIPITPDIPDEIIGYTMPTRVEDNVVNI